MNTMPFALKASMAGFSLLYAVCVSFFYVNLLPGMSTETTLAFESALNGAMVAGCVALAVFAAKSPRAAHADFPLMGAGHLFMLLALIALFAPGAPYLGVGHLATSGALAGLGMACAVPYYFALLAPYKRKIATYACGIVFLVGMALNIVVAMLPDSVAGVCLIAALMGSAACLYAVRRDRRANMRACEDECEGERGFGGEGAALLPNAHERSAMQGSGTSGACAISPEAGASTRASWRDLLNVFLVPVVCTFALSVVYRIIDVAAVGMGQPSAVATLVSQCGGVVAALVFLMYFSLRKNTSMSLLFNAVFGILATGILLLPFLPDQYTAFLNACAAAGWKLVMLSLFVLALLTYAHSKRCTIAAVALAYALPRFGLLVGVGIALALGVEEMPDFTEATAVAFFLLYVVLMAIWVANYHERKQVEQRAHAAREEAAAAMSRAREAEEKLHEMSEEQHDAYHACCDALAKQHGLTEREKSILVLLAQGRDISFIADALFLSKNTVKSYQKTIYAKMDVHSKQAIIDLVQDSLVH